MKRFFSIDADGEFEWHDTAEAAKRAAEANLQWAVDHNGFTDEIERVSWGALLGRTHTNVLHEHGPECEGPDGCPAEIPLEYETWAEFTIEDEPHLEVESIRTELAALRARVGEVLTTCNELSARYREGKGYYSFERAEAYEHAADLLTEALEAPGGSHE